MNRAFTATDYTRIFDPVPQDEVVAKHEEAIKELRTRLLKRRKIPELMATVSGLCEVFCDPPSVSDDVAQQVEDAIKKTDGSFLREGRSLELGVCAIAAANQSVASGREAENWEGWSVSDVVAGCVWSAVSFLPNCNGRKLEALRRWTIELARRRFWATGSAARGRYEVAPAKEFGRVSPSRDAYAAAVGAIRQLEINAILDKEEKDVLRWMMNGMSGIHDKPLQSLSSESRAITAGVEIGAFTPVPPTLFHRSHLLCGLEEKEPLSLAELLGKLGDECVQIAESLIDKSVFRKAPLVFPLMSAICSRDSTGPGADLARPLSEWGSRALLERVLLQIDL